MMTWTCSTLNHGNEARKGGGWSGGGWGVGIRVGGVEGGNWGGLEVRNLALWDEGNPVLLGWRNQNY